MPKQNSWLCVSKPTLPSKATIYLTLPPLVFKLEHSKTLPNIFQLLPSTAHSQVTALTTKDNVEEFTLSHGISFVTTHLSMNHFE